ncbi:MAG: hypothetical protein C0404_14125 [Verrucomicrobia bacterium]|nr:hypothetical protein [Verrucomicrobiota bacterium]
MDGAPTPRVDDMEQVVIVIDTREQRPYAFANAVSGTLSSGDYSIQGLEDRVTIERKTKADAYGSLGRGRARFQREFERLALYDYAAVVVEDTVPGFLNRPAHSKMNPKAAICSLLAWSVRYRVPVFFAGDRDHARALTYKLLEMFWRYRGEGPHERSAS